MAGVPAGQGLRLAPLDVPRFLLPSGAPLLTAVWPHVQAVAWTNYASALMQRATAEGRSAADWHVAPRAGRSRDELRVCIRRSLRLRGERRLCAVERHGVPAAAQQRCCRSGALAETRGLSLHFVHSTLCKLVLCRESRHLNTVLPRICCRLRKPVKAHKKLCTGMCGGSSSPKRARGHASGRRVVAATCRATDKGLVLAGDARVASLAPCTTLRSGAADTVSIVT